MRLQRIVLVATFIAVVWITVRNISLNQLNRSLDSLKHKKSEMEDLPTLYEYYMQGGITSGLEALPEGFQLNKRSITLFSGAIHYFRVHPDYWRDRLRKLRAAGFNTVETYVPWNLHEPQQDEYDFGDGDSEMSMFLDLAKYVTTAQEEDLFVLVRPSPYICAEWEFGGLPSWLLRYPGLRVRSSEEQYMNRVRKYHDKLLPLLASLQFTKGGPIIGFQIENEYGALVEDGSAVDRKYLEFLKEQFESHGLVELYYTSDNPVSHGETGSLPGEVFQTANFKVNPENELMTLKRFQPDKPAMVMEYWSGWFDHWFEPFHHTTAVDEYLNVLERILKFPASVNLYMFHGGTNWGFYNGGNVAQQFPHYGADVTSYDYDAPLTEAGDYTEKYEATRKLVAQYNTIHTRIPSAPPESKKMAYPAAKITGLLTYHDIIDMIESEDRTKSEIVVNMEMLPVNNGNGQSYGYVLYRHRNAKIQQKSVLKVEGDAVYDMAIVMLDGVRKTEVLTDVQQLSGFGFWELKDATLRISSTGDSTHTLDIFVENWGRTNFGLRPDFDQRKGLRKGTNILLDEKKLGDWEIISLQFKSKWIQSLGGWKPVSDVKTSSPTLFRTTFEVGTPCDTFLDMRRWGRGAIFVNGFNLGRYFSAGPPRTLYLPAPLLRTGTNEVVIFELFTPSDEIIFSDKPILGPTNVVV